LEWVTALAHDSIELLCRAVAGLRAAAAEWTTPVQPQQLDEHSSAPALADAAAAEQVPAAASVDVDEQLPSLETIMQMQGDAGAENAVVDSVAAALSASAAATSAAAAAAASSVAAALLSAHTVADSYGFVDQDNVYGALASAAADAAAGYAAAGNSSAATDMASPGFEEPLWELYRAAQQGLVERWHHSGLEQYVEQLQQWQPDEQEIILLVVLAHILLLSLLYLVYYFRCAAQRPRLYTQHASAAPLGALCTQRPPAHVRIATDSSSALRAVAHAVSPQGRLGRLTTQRYYPTPWLTVPFLSGHLQTVYTARASARTLRTPLVTYKRELLPVAAGSAHTLPGQVALDWAVLGKDRAARSDVPVAEWERGFTDTTPTVLVCHGLAGGSSEHYVKNTVYALSQPPHNFRCVVFNARGCGGSQLITPQLYCGAYTDDLRQVASNLRVRLPRAPLLAVGFSLGANILTKMLGEEGMAGGRPPPFAAAVSVANPFDFLEGARYLERNMLQRTLYSANLAKNLIKLFKLHMHVLDPQAEEKAENEARQQQQQEEEQDGNASSPVAVPAFASATAAVPMGRVGEQWDLASVFRSPTLREFDKRLTRVAFGYATVDDYYRDASSSRLVKFIHTPTLFLNALDDPISPARTALPLDEVCINPYTTLLTTPTGGHSMDHFSGLSAQKSWSIKAITAFLADVTAVHGHVGNQARSAPIATPPPSVAAAAGEFELLSSSPDGLSSLLQSPSAPRFGGGAAMAEGDDGAVLSFDGANGDGNNGYSDESNDGGVRAALQAELELQQHLSAIEEALAATAVATDNDNDQE
jgi:predicted alpha/beta-fold hydrolase